jgi:hypothetical protein
MSGELAVELFAGLLDPSGGVFKAAEVFAVRCFAQPNPRAPSSDGFANALDAAAISLRNARVLLVFRSRTFPQIDSAIV